MNKSVLTFKPFNLYSKTYKKDEVIRPFQMMADESLLIKCFQEREFVYPVQGEVALKQKDGKTVVLNGYKDKAKPFRLERDFGLITMTAKTDAILYHINEKKLDTLIFWSELKNIIDEKGEGVDVKLDVLISSPVFRNLAYNTISEVITCLQIREVGENEVVIKQDDPGDAFYIIDSGVAEVWRHEFIGDDEKKICDIYAGESFGEDALFSGNPRNATVKMSKAGKLLVLDKEDFVNLIAKPTLIEIEPQEAKSKSESGYVMLDVRYDEENEELFIPGSALIPLPELRLRIGELDNKADYVVFCRSGKRSAAAAAILAQQNFHALSMKGGIQKWPFEVEGWLAEK